MLDSIGKPNVNFYTLLGIAILNIALNFILIKQLGIIGAAYGTLTSMVIFMIVAKIILGREFNIKFTNTLRESYNFYVELLIFLTTQLKRSRQTK